MIKELVAHGARGKKKNELLKWNVWPKQVSTCYKSGMMGHFVRDCRRKGKGKGEGGRGEQGIRQR